MLDELWYLDICTCVTKALWPMPYRLPSFCWTEVDVKAQSVMKSLPTKCRYPCPHRTQPGRFFYSPYLGWPLLHARFADVVQDESAPSYWLLHMQKQKETICVASLHLETQCAALSFRCKTTLSVAVLATVAHESENQYISTTHWDSKSIR